jgi:pyruvate/2-oxoglutarate dehydrogenase complex dihydrolipoamide acyltransferase (E2) component
VVEFRMPSLGADMEAGTLVEWLVKPGDHVTRGDIVAVVETQKGAIEIETFETGTVERILVEIGTKVPVGTPLAIIETQGKGQQTLQLRAKPPPSGSVRLQRILQVARGERSAVLPPHGTIEQHGIDVSTIRVEDNAILLGDIDAGLSSLIQAPRCGLTAAAGR